MNKRFAFLVVSLITTLCVIATAWWPASPVAGQTPEPTITPVPPYTGPIPWRRRISGQVYQNTELDLSNYYNNIEQVYQLATVQASVYAISETVAFIYQQQITPTATIAPTPTVTPTPDPVVISMTLSSGNAWAVRREFTYGDVAVTISIMALVLLSVVRFLWGVLRM